MVFPSRRLDRVVELASDAGILPAAVPLLRLARPSDPKSTAEEKTKVQLALSQTPSAQYEAKKKLSSPSATIPHSLPSMPKISAPKKQRQFYTNSWRLVAQQQRL